MPITGMDEHVGEIAPKLIASIGVVDELTFERDWPNQCERFFGSEGIICKNTQLEYANKYNKEWWMTIREPSGWRSTLKSLVGAAIDNFQVKIVAHDLVYGLKLLEIEFLVRK